MLRLAWLYFRLGAMNEMQYRVNFFAQLMQSILGIIVALGGLAVIFNHTDTLGGWLPVELIAVIGVYYIVGGLIQTVIEPSMQRLMEDVRHGTLDFTLTKPADSQLLVSVQQFRIWKLVNLGLGLAILIVALSRLSTQLGVEHALAFGAALLCGAGMVYSFWLILATTAFWFVRMENILVIFQTMYEAGRWPVGIYPGWLRFALTFLVPVAFAVTVPAEALSNRLTAETLLLAAGLAVVMLIGSRLFWRYGLRHYSGASA